MPVLSRRPIFLSVCLLWLCTSLLPSPAQTAPTKPLDLQSEVLKQAKWRSIGPAVMGGRIADIAVDEKSPYTFFLGLATGGLLKTINNGTTWTSVFDSQPVASIGAVAIAPSDPKTVWVGTGEANGRNSSSWGDGVYRSTDGGVTWKNMGLKETQQIGRLLVDPKDANTVYVAAMGHLWGVNKERGIFKTTDGGKTWQHSLKLDEETGAIDLAQGANGILFAATYQRRRTAWGYSGIHPGSALYKSVDGGKNWKKLTNGLPTGALGRIGLSVARSKPETVYAVIESQTGGSSSLFDTKSKYGGIFRSDDSGETWKRVNGLAPRGFYFGQIRIDPTNPDRVYVLGFDLAVSDDGGKTFKTDGSPGVHSDLHAMWIDPVHPEHLLLGTDGGLYVSHDRTKTWDLLNNFPMGEFYEVSVDNRSPFWVYGGLQDNGSWGGPSAMQRNVGAGNADWVFLSGGDGFYVVTDPTDPDIVYSEAQNGSVVRRNRFTNQSKGLSAEAPEGEPSFRFNWNTPLAISPFDHETLYVGGSHLIKYTKKGAEWEAISPDLSKQVGARINTSGSGAESYGTIVTLAESPIRRGLIWAGTDDGNVQLTPDGGQNWLNLTNNLPEKVRELWISRIEASRFRAGRAYLAVDGHRSNDFATLLFVTEDYGRSWRSLNGDLPANQPIHVVREDPVNPDLLFVGTEFGAFASFDRGGHWHRLGQGLPTVAVDDLAIQARDHALVAATHGRSLFVLDNIAPLEDLTSKARAEDLHLFPLTPVQESIPISIGMGFEGAGRFFAANPPSGLEIVYWMKNLAEEAPSITVTDAMGKEVAKLSAERFPGLAHVRWDLRSNTEPPAEDRRSGNRFVKPGTYTVTLTVGKEKRSQTVPVSGLRELSDPENKEGSESGK
jgi:photosystem II stability/assembly factor-like uncharacterized protein